MDFFKRVTTAVCVGVTAIVGTGACHAQSLPGVDPYANAQVERVAIRIANPSRDSALDARVEDAVRMRLGLFPGRRFSQERFEFLIAQARRIPGVADIRYEVSFGRLDGIDVTLTVTLAEAAGDGRGLAFGGTFPVIYDRDGTFLRFKLDVLALAYGNNNAWYGQPDAMLTGNPLVWGSPSGEGWSPWIETFLHYGIYGITPLDRNTYLYGGLSGLASQSAGDEIFTDQTRAFNAVEDAYLGLVGGRTDGAGNRLVYNLSVGRKAFTLGDGFLIANTAGNGGKRAALQANARWAADLLVHGAVRHNDTLVEAFYLDPDELPILDTRTTYAGVNLEFVPTDTLDIGLSYITSPASEFTYFGPTGAPVGTREGLEVIDARVRFVPNGPGAAGPFLAGEIARQTNRTFDMDARAGWAEAGYSFAGARWSPTISYRYARFSGDDPATRTYERWDPMLAGGDGERWVQGGNHFKVVGDSNVIAHRLQARLRPSPKVELVPQLWAFYADSETNIGGNPALSVLDGIEYGYEANLTAKRFVRRNTYVHGHVAHTWPGAATKAALGGDTKNWLSAMVFVRYSF